MGALTGIKKKIAGVKNTRKITKAMQLVAASKSRQFQKRALSIRDFAFDLLYVFKNNILGIEEHMFTENREKGDTLFILYSSDKGLCGALNQKLFKALFNSDAWNNTLEKERKVIAIGKKAVNFVKYRGIKPEKTFETINEKISTYEAIPYIQKLLESWENRTVKKVYMVSPHYKNAFTFYPLIKQFLPLSDEMLLAHIGVHPEVFTKNLKNKVNEFMFYEPSQEKVTQRLMEELTQVLFMQAFYELKASEYSSRMMAMQSATDAADKIIKRKSLEFNKARQAAITQEIAEIVGASFI